MQDIYNYDISKNKQKKSLFPFTMFIVVDHIIIVLIIVKIYNRKQSCIVGPNNRKLDIR